jgi:hypothetical protein
MKSKEAERCVHIDEKSDAFVRVPVEATVGR